MKSILKFSSRFKFQITGFLVFLFFAFALDPLLAYAKSFVCGVEISDVAYAEIVIGSHERDEIKKMSIAFLSNDGLIDVCEAYELQKLYDELTSPKATLLGWL